jgi:hypothetical protein
MKKLYLFILLLTGSQLAMAQSHGTTPSDGNPSVKPIIAAPAEELVVYPTPASDRIHVVIPMPASGVSNIVFRDMLGRTIGTHRTTTQDNTIIISQWPEGVYLLSANTKDGTVTRRFVKAER